MRARPGGDHPYVIPANRPRYCVFDVAGAIVLQSSAFITVPKIYIAGQTSPGGIEFRLGANYNPVDSLVDTRKGGNDMILRHVRTRTGPHVGRTSENGDPIRMSGTNNQILDHVSTMFGTDESLDMACTNCTVQWSIIGPNICLNAGHTSSLHCKTFFLKPASSVTIAHNLSEHGEQRGINMSVGVNPPPAGNTGQADVLNNVFYDFIAETGLLSNQFGSVYANWIGNVALRGPKYNASDGNYLIGLYSNGAQQPFGFSVYSNGNVTPRNRIAGLFGSTTTDPFINSAGFIAHVVPSTVCGVTSTGLQDCSRNGLAVVQNTAYVLRPGATAQTFYPWQITSAEQGMRDVLAFAGQTSAATDHAATMSMPSTSTTSGLATRRLIYSKANGPPPSPKPAAGHRSRRVRQRSTPTMMVCPTNGNGASRTPIRSCGTRTTTRMVTDTPISRNISTQWPMTIRGTPVRSVVGPAGFRRIIAAARCIEPRVRRPGQIRPGR